MERKRKSSESRLVLIVSLWLKGEDVAAFEAFERQASQVMATHGGRIERAVRLQRSGSAAQQPFEIHIVSFPDQQAFDAYRNDKRAHDLAELRDQVIESTAVLSGYDVPVY